MRKLTAAILVAAAAGFAIPAVAADYTPPPPPPVIPPYIPPVDVGLEGSFYLRGSVGLNTLVAREVRHPDGDPVIEPVTAFGQGYSGGIGAGFETGTGLRFDVTYDHISNNGLSIDKGFGAIYSMELRSGLALANVYYDFPLSGHGGMTAAGGLFGYVGAGAGLIFNDVTIDGTLDDSVPDGTNTSLAVAGMVGLGYDFGSVVADVGYRGVYINQITNGGAEWDQFYVDHPWLHEVRGTVRYRFN